MSSTIFRISKRKKTGGLSEQPNTKETWRDAFQNEVLGQLGQMYSDQAMCDLTVVGDSGWQVKVHRVVLAMWSAPLRALLNNGMAETKQEKIQIKEVDEHIFLSLIRFMYFGELDLSLENAFSILQVADQYDISCVSDCCCTFILESLTESNCLQIFEKINQIEIGQDSLRENIKSFCLTHFETITQKEDNYIKNLNPSLLFELLQNDMCSVSDENVILSVISSLSSETQDILLPTLRTKYLSLSLSTLTPEQLITLGKLGKLESLRKNQEKINNNNNNNKIYDNITQTTNKNNNNNNSNNNSNNGNNNSNNNNNNNNNNSNNNNSSSSTTTTSTSTPCNNNNNNSNNNNSNNNNSNNINNNNNNSNGQSVFFICNNSNSNSNDSHDIVVSSNDCSEFLTSQTISKKSLSISQNSENENELNEILRISENSSSSLTTTIATTTATAIQRCRRSYWHMIFCVEHPLVTQDEITINNFLNSFRPLIQSDFYGIENVDENISQLDFILRKPTVSSQTKAKILSLIASDLTKLHLGSSSSPAILQLDEYLSNLLETDFCCDLPVQESSSTRGLRQCTIMNLDAERTSICINIFGNLISKDEGKKSILFLLCPIFRCLQQLQKMQFLNCLHEIDACLGAPIVMYELKGNSFQSLSLETRCIMCLSLTFAISWFDEIVRSFGTSKCGDEYKQKILLRIRDIQILRAQLEELQQHTPSFKPPKMF